MPIDTARLHLRLYTKLLSYLMPGNKDRSPSSAGRDQKPGPGKWDLGAAGRVPISDEVSRFIAVRIGSFRAEASAQLQWQVPYVAEFIALPLYLGWTATIGIRSDGEIICWSTEGDFAGARSEEDPTLVLSALVAGAARYPELGALLPVPGPNAVECGCRAISLCASGKIGCSECGGLGWLPGATD